MASMKDLANRLKELEDQLAVCMRCGMCQSVCPLFEQTRREADVARGKLALLDGLGKNMFDDPDGVNDRLNKCLLCGSCAANCPSGVNVVEIFIKARAILTEFKGLSPMKKLIFRRMLSNPSTFDQLTEWAGKFQGFFTKDEKNAQGTSCARLVSPLIDDRHIIPMADQPFRKRAPMLDTAPGKSGLKVAVFTGCIIDKIFPQIGSDLIEVFKYHGVGTLIPKGQGCCGIPALASGDMQTFEKLVAYHVNLFDVDNVDCLVTACATCTSTIKKLWPAIYEGKSSAVKEKIKKISEKTLDINQLLVDKVKLFDFDAHAAGETTEKGDDRNRGEKERVTYHDPCHLKKSLGVFKEPRAVIHASGKTLVEMTDSDKCCGMGGSFNLYHYGISSQIGGVKSQQIAETGCSTVATGCPACMVQISDMLAKAGLDVKVRHPIQLYAESLRDRNKI